MPAQHASVPLPTHPFPPRQPSGGRAGAAASTMTCGAPDLGVEEPKITADDTPSETWHMVFGNEGEVPHREGQSIGVVADGLDKNGKPGKLRLYSIASSALGDFGDSKTVLLCIKRLVYTNDQGGIVKGVCSNFLCDLKPGLDVNITGLAGKETLVPKDPNRTIIMFATGTCIAPIRSFLLKMFIHVLASLFKRFVVIQIGSSAGEGRSIQNAPDACSRFPSPFHSPPWFLRCVPWVLLVPFVACLTLLRQFL